MKATGIVRRIDDLGRVVIPKEIRRTLRIREGDPLEILRTETVRLFWKNTLQSENCTVFHASMRIVCQPATGYTVCIAETEQIVAVSGSGKKSLLEKGITHELRKVMEMRKSFVAECGSKNYENLTVEKCRMSSQAVQSHHM